MKPEPYSEIMAELLSMANVDQAMRTTAIKDRRLLDESVDLKHTARLKAIVVAIGWPTISKVGVDASHGAWLLVQHAIADLPFMKQCLSLMKDADEGDVALADIAYLEDRILIMEGKPQRYGTQFRTIDGVIEPFPIEDPTRVDERRAQVDLETYAENEARMKAMYGF